MALNPRVVKAFNATRALGLHDEEVKPILKKLLQVYEKNWELIEEDNYRTLFDAFFENKENKGVEDKDKIEGAAAGHSSSKKSSKRLHLPEPENQTSRLRIMESSSQPCLVDRTESSSQLPCAQSCDKGKRSILSYIHSGWSKSNSKKPPYAQEPLDKPSSIHFKRENVPTLPGLSEDSSSDHSVKPILSENGDIHGKLAANSYDEKRPLQYVDDITKGSEKVKIPLVDEIGNCCLPKFNYIPHNIIYQNGNVNISLARIADEDCCSSCSGDCLSSPIPCACARETGGEFAYTPQGLLTEDFLGACLSRDREPQEHHYVHCDDCPIERSRNKSMPEKCKGHLVRKFIKECWRKCGCNMKCGNRVVQRGITCKLQVFLTCDGKGWGLRPLEDLPKGTFVCEYVGEILTNSELFDRNKKTVGNGRHTYPVTLDADWGSEKILVDDEALCLDATFHGNAARFINHRCCDANLVEIPVEVETPDHHYYHLAFFTSRQVSAMEELTWDYGIDFSDKKHPVKAFRCCCKSSSCRDKKRKRK